MMLLHGFGCQSSTHLLHIEVIKTAFEVIKIAFEVKKYVPLVSLNPKP